MSSTSWQNANQHSIIAPHCATHSRRARRARGEPAASRRLICGRRYFGFQKQGQFGEAAAEALDGLDKLAQDGVGVPEFLDLLEDRSGYEPAWDRDDATIARARCLEARGKYLDAVHVLQDLFHRLATQEHEAGLDDAAGVLNRIRGYGIDPSSFSNLTDRYNALAAQESEAVPSLEGEPPRAREGPRRRRRGGTGASRGHGAPKAAGYRSTHSRALHPDGMERELAPQVRGD